MAKKKQEETFEEKLEKLQELMEKIESGEAGLQETINLFQDGMKLVKSCRETLDGAELQINKIVEGSDSETEPFDVEE